MYFRIITRLLDHLRQQAEAGRELPPAGVKSWLVVKPASGKLEPVIPGHGLIANQQAGQDQPTRAGKQFGERGKKVLTFRAGQITGSSAGEKARDVSVDKARQVRLDRIPLREMIGGDRRSLLQALNVGTKRLSFDHGLFQLLPLGGRTQHDLRALVSRAGKNQISMLAGGIFHDPRCGRVSRQICQPQNWRMKLRQFCERPPPQTQPVAPENR